MEAYLKQIHGISLVGKADSGHWVTMDGPEQFEGSSAATRPMELILLGLGGCTAMDVISILQKKRVKLDDFECFVSAERAENHPQVFTKVHIKYVFYGKNIPTQAVERAIELSQEVYCSASEMFRKTAELTHEYEIREEK